MPEGKWNVFATERDKCADCLQEREREREREREKLKETETEREKVSVSVSECEKLEGVDEEQEEHEGRLMSDFPSFIPKKGFTHQ